MRIFKKKESQDSTIVKSDDKLTSETLVDKSGSTWIRNSKGLYRTGNKVVKKYPSSCVNS